MQRSFAWVMIAVVAIILAPFAGVLGVPASAVRADTAAPAAAVDDEIVVITSALQLRVDDPTTPPGIQPATWSSASVPGWESGWTVVAGGDFNGDGDDELVAARGSEIKVFDPVVQPGSALVNFSVNLGSGWNVRLLSTGDFDADGKDEFAVIHYISGGGNQARLVWFDGGVNATPGQWTTRNSADYGAMFQDMAAGDFNADGADDLVLVRSVPGQQNLVLAWNVRTWSKLADRTDSPLTWLAAAAGNLDNSAGAPGDEMSLLRDFFDRYQTLVLLKYAAGALTSVVDNSAWSYNPPMTSISAGDLNGDGDDEVVMLRDPIQPKTSLLMVNPAGAAMNPFEQASGNGSAAFKIVRTGDTDGDGRDEVVILKSDRYRIYTEPEVGGQATETTGAFYATAGVSNLPFMAVANVDGPGITQGPTLGVTPTSLLFELNYGSWAPTQSLSITNVGSGSSFSWLAQITDGSSWLSLNGNAVPVSGNTPGQVGVSVKTDVAPGTYYGKIVINTVDPSVANKTVDIPVTMKLLDPGFAATPSQVTLWQKIGDPAVTREIKIVRWNVPTSWTATGLEGMAATDLAEKFANGQASVGDAGLVIDGVLAPALTWLEFTPTSGTTPSTMTVSVQAGTPAGTYRGRIFIVAAGLPTAEVNVTAIVADHFNFTFLPLVTK